MLKNFDPKDPNSVLEAINELEKKTQQPQYDINRREDVKVNIRVDESVAPAMFKPDPLLPGGYVANSLTIRAMRPDIFVLGDSIDDLSVNYQCACGREVDLQFWKLCPFCSRELKPSF